MQPKQTRQNPPQGVIDTLNLILAPYGIDYSVISKPEPQALKKYLTMKEAIEYSGLERWTLARKIKDGELLASKLSSAASGKILIAITDLDKYINGHRVKAGGAK